MLSGLSDRPPDEPRPHPADPAPGAVAGDAEESRDEELEDARPRGTTSDARRDRTIALVAAVVAALALLWMAGETHYRACVEAVQVRSGPGTDALSRLARSDGVEKCSRLPL
jgi:hypothetical protein